MTGASPTNDENRFTQMLQTVTGQGYFQNLTNADFHRSLWETDDLTDSDLLYGYET